MPNAKLMDMTTADVLDSDGFTALYGTGELHEHGSLPPGVPYVSVAADEAMFGQANPHAQQTPPAPKAAAHAAPAAAKSEAKDSK